ncbi:hypothetical protein THTE_1745 [Thermogutta terrifontis]|uniref:Uncharacterized protein n=1 Tax=Thermogutta terrifontis TaxID=1331910 RepID=A0A286REH2_9BACT|nr:hypothetical protein THTE_1745 [Thermogutta terrifontis]
MGANWTRPDRLRCQWRAVVDRWPTLKADQTISANHSLALAA